jgi:hypothetical protein
MSSPVAGPGDFIYRLAMANINDAIIVNYLHDRFCIIHCSSFCEGRVGMTVNAFGYKGTLRVPMGIIRASEISVGMISKQYLFPP